MISKSHHWNQISDFFSRRNHSECQHLYGHFIFTLSFSTTEIQNYHFFNRNNSNNIFFRKIVLTTYFEFKYYLGDYKIRNAF